MNERETNQKDGPREPISAGVEAVVNVTERVVGAVDAAIGALVAPANEGNEQDRRRKELSTLLTGRGREAGRSR